MKKLGLLAPLIIISFLTSCGPKEIEVNFKAFKEDTGTLLTINTRVGQTWSDIKDSKPSDPISSGFTFSGWSLTDTGAGEPITDEYVFTDDTTLYGIFSYEDDKCSIVSESLQIVNVTGKYGEPLVVHLSVKEEAASKYELPLVKDKFDVETGESLTKITNFEYSRDGGTLTIPSDEIKESITITVDDYQPEYNVTANEDSITTHLIFSNYSEGNDTTLIKAKKGENYQFMVSATNDSFTNSVVYYVPKDLAIYIGEATVPIARKFYDIDPVEKEEGYTLSAIVTIFDNVIKDDIKIDGRANHVEYYRYEIYNLGGIIPKEGLSRYNEDLEIDIESVSPEYACPQEENVYVIIDDGSLKHVTDDSIKDIVSYTWDEYRTFITIKNTGKDNIDSFVFFLMAADYPIEKVSWSNISAISTNGYADCFFKVGDVKHVCVDSCEVHEARIIGLNHDEDTSGNKVGITFEFAQVITTTGSKVPTTYWNYKDKKKSKNTDFPHSSLNEFLNGTEGSIEGSVFQMLPEELKLVIREIYKKVGQGKNYKAQPYKTKLFPLASAEIGSDETAAPEGEGTKYQYYVTHKSKNDRKKRKVAGESSQSYWLRSPNTNDSGNDRAYYVYANSGEFTRTPVYYSAFAVAPAFCV